MPSPNEESAPRAQTKDPTATNEVTKEDKKVYQANYYRRVTIERRERERKERLEAQHRETVLKISAEITAKQTERQRERDVEVQVHYVEIAERYKRWYSCWEAWKEKFGECPRSPTDDVIKEAKRLVGEQDQIMEQFKTFADKYGLGGSDARIIETHRSMLFTAVHHTYTMCMLSKCTD